MYIYIYKQKTWQTPSFGFEKNRFHTKNTFFVKKTEPYSRELLPARKLVKRENLIEVTKTLFRAKT